MIQALIVKTVIKAVMKLIIKQDDSILASGHEKRIKALEELAHPKRELICKCCKNKENK
jgi:tRNA(Arg) A34 adenosine deaminase TadA